MIKDTNENVKLTFEQLQQIDEVSKQLINLQSEITTAQKILRGTRLEIDRAIKEKTYQEELLEELKSTVLSFETKKADLVEQINQAITILDETTKRSSDTDLESKIKIDELHKKESELARGEETYSKKVEEFTSRSNQLLEDQLSIKTAKDAFLKATETVVW